jgi:acyl carrier protein
VRRDDVLREVRDYLGFTAGDIPNMDSLDWIDVAMQLEDEYGAVLPQYADALSPPPPYATPEAFADAVIVYHAAHCHSEVR